MEEAPSSLPLSLLIEGLLAAAVLLFLWLLRAAVPLLAKRAEPRRLPLLALVCWRVWTRLDRRTAVSTPLPPAAAGGRRRLPPEWLLLARVVGLA